MHPVRINAVRQLPLQPQDHRSISAMALAGEGQGSIQLDCHPVHTIIQIQFFKISHETLSSPHWPHGMGTRWAYTHLENVEDTDAHDNYTWLSDDNDNRLVSPPTAAVLIVSVRSVAKRCR